MDEIQRLEAKIKTLSARLSEAEAKNKELEKKYHILDRGYTCARATIERAKGYNVAKDRFLTSVIDEKAKQEKYFTLLLENTRELMFLLDHKLRIEYCSGTFLIQAGISNTSMVYDREFQEVFREVTEGNALDEMMPALEEAIINNEVSILDRVIDVGMQGNDRHYTIYISPMLNEEGKAEGVLMMFQDMTEIYNAKEQAEAASKAKTSFLARMSHEIRTPMNAIIGMTELALRDADSPVLQEYLANIRQAGSNLLSIINDILDLTRIESGNFHLNPLPYSLSSLLNNVINVIRIRFSEKPVLFLVNIDAGLPNDFIGDETRIRQILFNILSNAVKYTLRGFIKLTVNGAPVDDRRMLLQFEVADSGIGIKEKDMGELFGDFVRLDAERNKGIEGTGLGLAITRRLCRQMEGDLLVSSVYGEGSIFTARFPQPYTGENKLAEVENSGEKRVLLYDEHPVYAASVFETLKNLQVAAVLCETLPAFFTELEGGHFSFAFASSAAVEAAAKIIGHLKLPTNLVLLAEMGELSSFQDIPVILMPAYAIPVANVLNGITTNEGGKKNLVRFTAPGARILIVDDIMTNLKVAQGLLMPYQMQVDITESGAGALELIKEHFYDIIFMDHMMPVMDGIEVTGIIRKMEGEYFRQVPIIALTANAIAGMRETFLQCGFNDYLAKPVEISKLNELMEKWIPQEKRQKPGNALPPARPRTLADIEGLDTIQGIMLTGGSEPLYREVLDVYSRDCEERLKMFRKPFDRGELQAFIINVHALKSASASVGAGRVSEKAALLEQAGRNEDLGVIEDTLKGFTGDLEKLVRSIRNVLDQDE
ncbi:MAG: response regulator [Treponema sp.]|nr:response regulator [Treponema sp.]